MLRYAIVLLLASATVLAQSGSPTETKPSGKAPEVSVPSYANANCPLMSRTPKPDIFVESSHGRVWLCCKNCLAKAKKDAEGTYAKAYPTATKVANKTDPVNGKPVKDGVTAVYQGYEIGLSDAANAKAVVANGDVYVTLLTKSGVKDVNNTKDPISGNAVADNLCVLVGDSLVRLSSADSVEGVKKDPAKALEAAKKTAKTLNKS
jgi:hypothetical protein